jgi:hypothetical protein
MLKPLLIWAITLLMSVVMIQVASDLLYMRALAQQDGSDGARLRRGQIAPVHFIEREASPGGIIT